MHDGCLVLLAIPLRLVSNRMESNGTDRLLLGGVDSRQRLIGDKFENVTTIVQYNISAINKSDTVVELTGELVYKENTFHRNSTVKNA